MHQIIVHLVKVILIYNLLYYIYNFAFFYLFNFNSGNQLFDNNGTLKQCDLESTPGKFN